MPLPLPVPSNHCEATTVGPEPTVATALPLAAQRPSEGRVSAHASRQQAKAVASTAAPEHSKSSSASPRCARHRAQSRPNSSRRAAAALRPHLSLAPQQRQSRASNLPRNQRVYTSSRLSCALLATRMVCSLVVRLTKGRSFPYGCRPESAAFFWPSLARYNCDCRTAQAPKG